MRHVQRHGRRVVSADWHDFVAKLELSFAYGAEEAEDDGKGL
jgi:hypothetical protein